MTIRASKFTPRVLLEAPRRSPAIPNARGTLALFTSSQYSFESHSKSSEIGLLDIHTGRSQVIANDTGASEPTWLGEDDLILWFLPGEQGTTKLMLADASSPSKSSQTIATIGGPVSNLKIVPLDNHAYLLVFTGQATPKGSLYNPEKSEKAMSSAKIYDSLFVRQWDTWTTENKNAIWYGKLTKSGTAYQLGPVNNALSKGSGPMLESPVPPFGGTDQFAVCKSGLAFVAKDPTLNPATHTKTDLYLIRWKHTKTSSSSEKPQIVPTGEYRGYCQTPVFSPDEKSLAFTRMKSDIYEADKARLMLIPDVDDLGNVQEFFTTKDGEGAWDRSVGTISWSRDGKDLYVLAEDYGRVKLFILPSSPSLATSLPKALTQNGSISDFRHLSSDSEDLFLSSASFIDSSQYSILKPRSEEPIHVISSATKHGRLFGLNKNQIDETEYEGADGRKIHAWIVKPSNFDAKKTYPLAYLIHGGPQGAWTDSWSTRWNPAVFAEQGYVVVTPNPTGSTGYGFALQNAIQNSWGGKPYEDLCLGFEHIEKNLPYIDVSRAVALGASYGGYMCNWIQGHDLGRKFQALVTHDGIFSTMNNYATEELFFPIHEFEGTLWDQRENYERWDPARFLKNWATPHLIIHSELDYRLPVTEGLSAFNVLQSRGIPSRLLTFPDENHWVLKPENSLVWHREVFKWINEYAGIEQVEEEKSL